MQENDQLFRFSFDNLDIRGELVHLDQAWQEVLARHEYPEAVRVQLGSGLAAAALLSLTIKFKGNLILQIQGDGPLKSLVTQAGSDGSLRGLARWDGLVPQGPLQEVFGDSRMVITMIPEAGERYQSIVEMTGETLADALSLYFMQSEQLPTSFQFHVSENRTAGLLLQALPLSSTSHARQTQHQEDWQRINLLADTITPAEIQQLAVPALLHRLFHEEQVRLHAPKPLHFSCTCSRKKVENTLISLGESELRAILAEEGHIKVDCEFCNTHYTFDTVDIENLCNELRQPPPDTVLH
jgi:molecular chaperone Hsp33